MTTLRVFVHDPAGAEVSRGTAWVVRPGVLCTAFHGVCPEGTLAFFHEEQPGCSYWFDDPWKGTTAMAPLAFDADSDVALFAASTEGAPLPLSSTCREGARWRADGFPAGAGYDMISCSGTVTRLPHGPPSARMQLHVREGTVADWRGVSGAAVRDGSDGHVIGVLMATVDSVSSMWATPLEAVHRLLELADLAEQVQRAWMRWHAHPDPADRWQACNFERLRLRLDELARREPEGPEWAAYGSRLAQIFPRERPRPAALHDLLREVSTSRLHLIKETYTDVIDDKVYVRREMEADLRNFVSNAGPRKPAMVIVGQSGMGKSTLVTRFLRDMVADGHVGFFIKSGDVASEHAQDFRHFLTKRLSEVTGGLVPPTDEGVAQADHACSVAGKYLIVAIDAVNEFGSDQGKHEALRDYLHALDGLVNYVAEQRLSATKLIITSRPETWLLGDFHERIRAQDTENRYYGKEGHVGNRLGLFSVKEALRAYHRFMARRRRRAVQARQPAPIFVRFGSLSKLTQFQLRDPFMLTLVCEANIDHLPDDLDTDELYQAYRRQKIEMVGVRRNTDPQARDPLADEAAQVLVNLTRAMFDGDVVTRDSVQIDAELHQQHRLLYEQLDERHAAKLRQRMVDANLIRAIKGDTAIWRVRFAYDRFVQFLLAEEMLRRIAERSQEGGQERIVDAACRIILANLGRAQGLPTLLGALRRVLVVLGDRLSAGRRPAHGGGRRQAAPIGHADLLRRVAIEGEERGMALSVSVLGRLATRDTLGHEGLESLRILLQQFADDHADSARKDSGSPASFPLVDAVYRIILDEEYRAWRSGKDEQVRRRHCEVLYTYFDWGLQNVRDDIAGSTAQYLFYLWQIPQTRDDAEAILRRNIEGFHWWDLRRLRGRRSMIGSAWAICFVLARQNDESVGRVLSAGKTLAARIGLLHPLLGHVLALVAGMLIEREVERELTQLQYPVSLQAMQDVFDNGASRREAKDALDLLRFSEPWGEPQWRVAEALISSENALVLQFLCFSLSTAFETLRSPPARDAHLARLCALFPASAQMRGAHYVVALALYHINFFGDHATPDSLRRMGAMADVIMRQGKGMFLLKGREFSTNIIGTYGRSLRRHADLLHDEHDVALTPPLSYAIGALEEAKRTRNPAFYTFVCNDIGLLGVLTEPRQVFEVFTYILSDLGLSGIAGSGSSDSLLHRVFDTSQRAAIKEQTIASLANIRAIYRAEVDRYLLDELINPELYREVSEALPKFNLTTIASWTSEQLIFVVMTRYRVQFGEPLVQCFLAGLGQQDAVSATKVFVRSVFDKLRRLGPALA